MPTSQSSFPTLKSMHCTKISIAYFSFFPQHRELRSSLPPVGSLKWDFSEFLRALNVSSLSFQEDKDPFLYGWSLTKLPESLWRYGSSSSKVPSKVTPQTQDHIGTMRDFRPLYWKQATKIFSEFWGAWQVANRIPSQYLLHSEQPKSSQKPEALDRWLIGYQANISYTLCKSKRE